MTTQDTRELASAETQGGCGCGPDCRCGPQCACATGGKCAPACGCGK